MLHVNFFVQKFAREAEGSGIIKAICFLLSEFLKQTASANTNLWDR